eukprot:15329170-Heterocapsa_arctica.AAC.1
MALARARHDSFETPKTPNNDFDIGVSIGFSARGDEPRRRPRPPRSAAAAPPSAAACYCYY